MTDEQLLDLIETKAPEELTLNELAWLERRLKESPMLREALAARLGMEQYLSAALGRVNVSVDDILSRAGNAPARRTNPALPVVGWILCLLLLGFVGLVLLVAFFLPPAEGPLHGRKPVANRAPGEAATDEESGKAAVDPAAPGATEQNAADPANVATAGQPLPLAATPNAPTPNVAAPAPAKNPWDLPDEAPQFSAAALFSNAEAAAAPRDEDLKQWFSEAPDLPHGISNKDYYGRQLGMLDGVWRLRAPLRPQTALRLKLADFHNLQIHCWQGTVGVTLHYFEHANHQWVAYQTSRKGGEARPATIALEATDEDRFWRTNPLQPTMFELRFEPGLITLVRGDVRVLSAPCQGTPDEIYFDGHAIFREIAVVPAAELPALPQPHPLLVDVDQPATLPWSGELVAGANFQKLPDGRVELAAEKNDQPAWVAVALPNRDSLCEIVCQLNEPQPGTGFYLGDDQGPRYPVQFFREAHRGETSFFPLAPGDGRTDSNHDFDNAVAPMSLKSPWFRLVFGCGTLKCWTSADGTHWGRAFDPLTNQEQPYTHLGLYCVAGQPRKSIQLRRLQLRDLPTINALAPAELRAKALALPRAADLSQWLATVVDAQPVESEPGPWRRACAIRTLAAGTSNALGTPLLDSLLDEVIEEHKSVSARLALLDEAALLYHAWDDGQAALRFAQRYEHVGATAYRQGSLRPCSLIEHAQRVSPIWARHPYNFLPDALVRCELLELTQAGQWGELADFCQQELFWRHVPHQKLPPTILDWAAAVAGRQIPKQAGREAPTLAADWRHPLLVELSKEGYNLLAEFRAALDGRSYRDACQIISTSAENGMLGLLPDSQDTNLLVSLPGAVALAMRDHPGLAATMNEQFGPVGRLRVRQAIADNDVSALEAATIQFYGTEAAGEARLFLAERSLSGGAFAHALALYRQAQQSASPEIQPRIAAGEQLAGALLGQRGGSAKAPEATFGQSHLNSEQFAALLDELRKVHQADNLAVRGDAGVAAWRSAPSPAGSNPTVRFRFEGDGGHEPQNVPGEMNQFNIDWAARQMSLVAVDGRLLVSNRYQVTAYDLNSNQLLWRNELGGDHGRTHEWTLAPMRPLVTAGRIFVRRLTQAGPALAAINSADGKTLWTTKAEPEKWVVADPLLIQEELIALVMTRVEPEYTLALTAYDPQSGAVVSSRPLLRWREPWWQMRTCQAVADGDRLIASCGGAVFACDLLGQLHWVRRENWVPAPIDRSWMAQSQDPPLVHAGRVFVAQPGVHGIAAIDTESGRLAWRRTIPAMRRIVGLADERLIVETDEGFESLDVADGHTGWFHDAVRRLDGVLCGGSGGLLYVRADAVRGENNVRPVLVWVDLDKGRAKGEVPLDTLKHERPKMGPLLAEGERLWAFFGRGDQDPNREVVELVAEGPVRPPTEAPAGINLWNRSTEAVLRDAAATVLPKWTLLGGRVDGQTGIQPEWQQEKTVLSTLSTPGRPLELVRRIQVPATGTPKLRLRVSNDPAGKWQLLVHIAGSKVLEQEIDQAFTGGGWKDLDIDLKPFTGQQVWVVISQIDGGGPQPYAKWKRLQLIP